MDILDRLITLQVNLMYKGENEAAQAAADLIAIITLKEAERKQNAKQQQITA